jgi:rod shape-determining protein MreD
MLPAKPPKKLIFLSLLCAFILSIVPLPGWLEWYRPAWVTLVVIYWTLFTPQSVGIVSAWCAGFILDLMMDTLLGEHALSLAVVAYLSITLSHRVRQFPVWQQAFVVLLLVGMDQLILLWIQGVTGNVPRTWLYWLSAVVSMLIWPLLVLVLQRSEWTLRLRRRIK